MDPTSCGYNMTSKQLVHRDVASFVYSCKELTIFDVPKFSVMNCIFFLLIWNNLDVREAPLNLHACEK